MRQLERREHLRIRNSQEAVDADQHARPAAVQDELCFVTLEPRVERDDAATRCLNAERCDDPVQAVRTPDRDAVAGSEPRDPQAALRGSMYKGDINSCQADFQVFLHTLQLKPQKRHVPILHVPHSQ
jgi:hypothetical protein